MQALPSLTRLGGEAEPHTSGRISSPALRLPVARAARAWSIQAHEALPPDVRHLRNGARLASRPRRPPTFDRLVDVQGELEQGRFRGYAEIVAESLTRVRRMDVVSAARMGAEAGTWPLFPDSREALRRLRRTAKARGHHQQRPAPTASRPQAQLGFRLDEWICAEEVRAYKPDRRIWEAASRKLGKAVRPLLVARVGVCRLRPAHRAGAGPHLRVRAKATLATRPRGPSPCRTSPRWPIWSRRPDPPEHASPPRRGAARGKRSGVEREQPACAHDGAAVHQHVGHVARARRVDDAAVQVLAGGGWRVGVRRSTTVTSPRFPGSSDPISRSSPSARAPRMVVMASTSAGGIRARPEGGQVQRGGEAHLVEGVQRVVARRSVGADRDVDSL